MCLKRKKYTDLQIINPPSAFVYMLNQAEIHTYKYVIKHVDAVFNINYTFKEGLLMIEKLQAYRAQLENQKAVLSGAIIDVEAEVAEFRQAKIAEAEANRAAEIAKIDNFIECVDKMIADAQIPVDVAITEAVAEQ